MDEREVPVVSAEGCRYLALSMRFPDDAPPVALRVTSPDFPCLKQYVLPNAQLGGVAVFQTPGQWGTTRIGSQDIIPETTYQVRAQQQDGSLSEAGQATTNSWGDVIGAFRDDAWTPGNGIVDILDLTAALDRFINRPGAPPLEWCDMGPAVPDRIIDITTDVLAIVDAFRGLPYPYDPPTPCP